MNRHDKSKFSATKIMKKVVEAFWWTVTIALVLLMFNVIGSKMNGKVPKIFGYSVVRVISGSMEDAISQGEYILIKSVDPEVIQKGDIICFYSVDSTIYGLPNTHRVVEDPIITDSGIEFVTKGDANPINDKVNAKGENLIGIYIDSLDSLTDFTEALDGRGMAIIIFILAILTMILALISFLNIRRQRVADIEKNTNNELSVEEIEKILSDNPEILKKFEEKTGISLK